MTREIFVTGRGMVSSLGVGVEQNWTRAASGESGLRRSVALGESVTAELLADCEAVSGRDRLFDLAALAYEEAVRSAALSDETLSASGLLFARGCPASETIVKDAKKLESGRPGRPDTVYRTMENHVASRLAAEAGVAGPVVSNSAACCGSAQSIFLGHSLIRAGICDVCVCGGADVIDAFAYHAFGSMRIVLARDERLSEHAIRPYGSERCGIALGEGAGFVVLESGESLDRRGGRALARVDDVVQINSGDARFGDVSDPQLWGELFDRTSGGTRVEYVVGHGTSTVLGDAVEARAVARRFGDCPVTSTKYLFGHTLAASTVLDIVLLTVALSHRRVIGTGEHYRVDPALDGLNLVHATRAHAFATALKLSAGFGGAMNCILLSEA